MSRWCLSMERSWTSRIIPTTKTRSRGRSKIGRSNKAIGNDYISNGFVGNRRYNSASSVHQMHVQISEFPSFPHAFSRSTMLTDLRGSKGGNPDEDLTGPPTLRQVAQGRGE